MTVMHMKNSKELLTEVYKTILEEKSRIHSVLDACTNPSFRKALESQMREYDSIECEACTIASQRSWDLPEPDPVKQFFSNLLTRMKMSRSNCDSRIAGMLILTNTKSMVKGLKCLHQYPHPNDRISCICQKLLDSETVIIRSMQDFL